MAETEEPGTTTERGSAEKRARGDLAIKLLSPLVVGLLMALAGFITQLTVSKISSQQENARLITELQIQREKAESDLRQGVFDKAFESLISPESAPTAIPVLSDRLLKLELLALNFGDTLSLSPLFAALRRDLDRCKPTFIELSEEQQDVVALSDRLESLAKQVASTQVASLAQYGVYKPIRIPLDPGTKGFPAGVFEVHWPDDAVDRELIGLKGDPSLEDAYQREFDAETATRKAFTLNGIVHQITLTFDRMERDAKTIRADIEILSWPEDLWNSLSAESRDEDSAASEIKRRFTLDYFNFPKIDNTRLFGNERFSLVLENFDAERSDPIIEMAAVVFPSEYASLRDRPGMSEAVRQMNKVVEQQRKEGE